VRIGETTATATATAAAITKGVFEPEPELEWTSVGDESMMKSNAGQMPAQLGVEAVEPAVATPQYLYDYLRWLQGLANSTHTKVHNRLAGVNPAGTRHDQHSSSGRFGNSNSSSSRHASISQALDSTSAPARNRTQASWGFRRLCLWGSNTTTSSTAGCYSWKDFVSDFNTTVHFVSDLSFIGGGTNTIDGGNERFHAISTYTTASLWARALTNSLALALASSPAGGGTSMGTGMGMGASSVISSPWDLHHHHPPPLPNQQHLHHVQQHSQQKYQQHQRQLWQLLLKHEQDVKMDKSMGVDMGAGVCLRKNTREWHAHGTALPCVSRPPTHTHTHAHTRQYQATKQSINFITHFRSSFLPSISFLPFFLSPSFLPFCSAFLPSQLFTSSADCLPVNFPC
jgi:hypothetical protein